MLWITRTRLNELEDLIVKTREDLSAKIEDLKAKMDAEKGQVKKAIGDLTAVVNVLQAKILQLQTEQLPQDYSEEYEKLSLIMQEIDSIYVEPEDETEIVVPTDTVE